MNKLSQILAGTSVREIKKIQDYEAILLSNGSTLNIYNNHTIDYGLSDQSAPREILSVVENNDCIMINLAERGVINIGMRDTDFHGPEAMSYKGDEGLIVWP